MKAANRLLFESFGPVTDAGIRRAISTAYYALFHDVVETATDQFVGRDRRGTAGYAIIYRAFSHTRMKKIFNDIDRDQLSPKYREALGRQSVNLELRKFARFLCICRRNGISRIMIRTCFSRGVKRIY